MNDYIPVACGFHDRLEHLAMSRRHCRVRYVTEGRESSREGRIRDIITAAGAEYLIMDDDSAPIRLDHIVEIASAEAQAR